MQSTHSTSAKPRADFSHLLLLPSNRPLGDFEQDIYISEGIPKILTSLKENPDDEKTQIVGAQLLAFLALDGTSNSTHILQIPLRSS